MKRRSIMACLAIIAGFALATAGFGQGVQSANLVGTVTSADGSPLPGVSVTVTSPTLIGERSTVSSVNGSYIFKALPPGAYTVRFALEGMQTVERTASLKLGGTSRADATLELSAAEETIVVVGEAPSALETTTVGANFQAEEVGKLPMGGRTISGLAEYAPGLTDNTPNAGQLTISGAFAYDNVFLVNGVDVNDNLFGTPNNLFIEDAIAEVQVLTSGISAEYGRFSGGVVNVITKSGGNSFSGSIRADLSKPNWRDETPYEKERNQKREGDLSKAYMATLGGPVMRDRVWFFLAGRDESTTDSTTLPVTGFQNNPIVDNTRYEVKLTGNLTQNHTLQASYVDNSTDQSNRPTFSFTIDPRARVNRTLPNDGFVVAYNGVFTNRMFGEVRYSEKAFGFRNTGGTSTDIFDSPIISQGVLPGSQAVRHYNAPYFDSTDPEDRNNEQIYGALSLFLSSQALGSHDLKLGYEQFTTTRTGGNSQSSTNYVYDTDYLTAGGAIVYDSQGRIIPVFTPFLSGLEFWLAERGANIDIVTDSIFVNDRWNLNANWSFNLGLRYEQVQSDATGGITTIDTDRLVPRLGVSYDPLGNGKYKLDVTYAQYAGKYSESQFAENTTVGNPRLLYGYYVGPAGSGVDFAPGFSPDNYIFYYANDPTGNVFSANNLSSPVTTEITLAAGVELPAGGYAKLIYTNREIDDFVEDFIAIENGQTNIVVGGIEAGLFDNRVFRNTSVPKREYEALQLQGRYEILDNWNVGLGWTYQLKNDGTFEGENTNQPGISSTFGDFPEILGPAADRYFPNGRLNDFQEHKIRLWSSYTFDLGRAGALNFGAVWRYDSATTFSYVASNYAIPAQLLANDPGYAQPPRRQSVYFGERGVGEYNGSSLFDVSVGYQLPLWKSLEVWVKLDVYNVFNDDTLQTFNTTVSADRTGPVDANQLPTAYTRSVNFGRPTTATDYVTPLEYFISAGIRF